MIRRRASPVRPEGRRALQHAPNLDVAGKGVKGRFIAVVAAIGVAGAAWWWLPRWQMKSITAADPKARADIEDNFRKTIGQALGGIAVLLARWRPVCSLPNSRTPLMMLISNQVAKGFEQLGSSQYGCAAWRHL
jgi:hypothetical protein